MRTTGGRDDEFDNYWQEYCKYAIEDPQAFVDQHLDFESYQRGASARSDVPSGDEDKSKRASTGAPDLASAPWKKQQQEPPSDEESSDDSDVDVGIAEEKTIQPTRTQLTNAEIALLKAAAAGRSTVDPPTVQDYMEAMNLEVTPDQEKRRELATMKRHTRQQDLGKFAGTLFRDPVPNVRGYTSARHVG